MEVDTKWQITKRQKVQNGKVTKRQYYKTAKNKTTTITKWQKVHTN
jgi:hypothetical protein